MRVLSARARAFAACVLAGLIAAPVAASAQTDWRAVGERTTPRNTSYVGGFALSGMNGVWRYDIYSRFVPYEDAVDGTGSSHFAIRKSLNNPDGLEQIQWADETDCPQVLGVLRALDEFQSPQIGISGLRRRIPPVAGMITPPMPPPDGNGYSLWLMGRTADGAFVNMALSGGAGLIAQFGEFARKGLAACWRDEIPAGFEGRPYGAP